LQKIKKLIIYIALFFIITILVVSACTDEKNQSQIVANWNDISISLSDFERVYFNSWQFKGMADSPELRRAITRELIEKELIVRQAEKNSLIDENLYRQNLKREYGRILRRRYLEVTIKDTIKVPADSELREKLLRRNKALKVRQIYSKSYQEIKKLSERLRQGENFEDMAIHFSRDSSTVLAFGTVGWLKWDEVDINVEKALFNLKENEVSEPVQSLGGWHIFKVDSIRTTIQFNTDTDPYDMINLRYQIINRKLEVAGAEHIKNLVWTKKLVINARLFKRVWAHIEPNLPDSDSDKILYGYNKLEDIMPEGDLGEAIIAKVDDVDFTVNDFLYALPDIQRHLLTPNLRHAIEVAIRNKIITETAIEKGFTDNPVVQEKYRRAGISYKYAAAMVAADSVLEHKVNLKSYYERHKEKYIDFIESEIEQILVDDRSLAISIAKKIYNGEDFEKLERKYNIDSASGHRSHTVSSKDNPLGKKAADLRIGDVFAPVKTEKGYYVIRVIDQKKHYLPFENIKSRLAKSAQSDYYIQLHDQLLPDDYTKQKIEYNDDKLGMAFTEKSNTIF